MTSAPVRHEKGVVEKRQEWYQVLYHLSAQRGHQAESVEQKDEKLLQRATRDAALLVNRASATLLSFGVTRADELNFRLPTDGRDLALVKFLQDIVEPSTVVLLAGLLRELHEDWRHDQPHELDRKRLWEFTNRLQIGPIESRADDFSPDELVGYVLQWQAPSYRIRYNLACYFAGSEKTSGDALQALSGALGSVPAPRDTAALAAWSLEDPTLQALRDRDPAGFHAVVDPWAPAKLPDRRHSAEGGPPVEPA
jgi:hypothetical protein